ncbi:RNA-directed DNA polymerase, eukaryota, reverse transcriptase zinc-binding domain protein [Tanacetum coccineum]
MLSELMSWYKKKKKNLMLFKIDFEKAFEIVSWKFLDHMLLSLGFENNWCRWIHVCLHSARAFVLINGSPSSEFSLKRGLRQGDPLSLFLFIIIMEGLHIAFKDAVSLGLISGAMIGDFGFKLSYLFYAYDVVIISDWNSTNDIENLARDTGYGSGNIPFSYLGLPLGGGSSEKKNMAWIKWENVLASFEKGGLNIRSLKSFNLALLQKWRWRLVNNSDSLWARVIIAIHDVEAGLVLKGCNCNGVWSSIISSYSLLHDRNFLPLGTLCRKVGNGTSIRFWKDSWNGNGPLMTRFNRLYHLDANKDCLLSDWNVNGSWVWSWKRQVVGSQNEVALNILVSDLGLVQLGDRVDNILVSDLGLVQLGDRSDSWSWSLDDDGIFSVHVSLTPCTRWWKILPRKVNVFVWLLTLDRLLTRLNLSLRGLEIPSILCPMCYNGVESVDHVFFGCELASNI